MQQDADSIATLTICHKILILFLMIFYHLPL